MSTIWRDTGLNDCSLSLSLIHDEIPLLLPNNFHGHQLPGLVVSALEDSTEASLTHHLHDLIAVGHVVFDNLRLKKPIHYTENQL